MMLTLDNLAHRYHLLPSEVLARATTLDLFVIDLGARWSEFQVEEERRRSTGQAAQPKRMPTQREMLDMIERAKELK